MPAETYDLSALARVVPYWVIGKVSHARFVKKPELVTAKKNREIYFGRSIWDTLYYMTFTIHLSKYAYGIFGKFKFL